MLSSEENTEQSQKKKELEFHIFSGGIRRRSQLGWSHHSCWYGATFTRISIFQISSEWPKELSSSELYRKHSDGARQWNLNSILPGKNRWRRRWGSFRFPDGGTSSWFPSWLWSWHHYFHYCHHHSHDIGSQKWAGSSMTHWERWRRQLDWWDWHRWWTMNYEQLNMIIDHV